MMRPTTRRADQAKAVRMMRVTDPRIMLVIPVEIIMIIPTIIKLVTISVIVGVHTPTPLGCGVCTLANF